MAATSAKIRISTYNPLILLIFRRETKIRQCNQFPYASITYRLHPRACSQSYPQELWIKEDDSAHSFGGCCFRRLNTRVPVRDIAEKNPGGHTLDSCPHAA